MIWRGFLALLALAAWLLFVWLAGYRSPEPEVLGRWSTGYALGLLAALLPALLLTAAQGRPLYTRLLRARARLLAAAIATVLTLALLEGFTYAFDPLGVSTYEETQHYGGIMEEDARLVYKHRAGVRTTLQGVLVETNELGLRDPPLAPKEDRELRILVLGDSVTFGWGVAAEATFCRRLEPLLGRQAGRPVRVVNSGVGGYNSVQELRFLETSGESIAPDLVVLVYVHNDVAQPHARTEDTPPEALGSFFRRSRLFRIAEHVLCDGLFAPPESASRETPGWRRSMEAVEAMCVWCEERALPFVPFLYRRHDSAKYAALTEDLGQIAAAHGVPLGDTGPWFVDRTPAEVCNSVMDVHPNARGHEIVARGMARFLEESGVLRKAGTNR